MSEPWTEDRVRELIEELQRKPLGPMKLVRAFCGQAAEALSFLLEAFLAIAAKNDARADLIERLARALAGYCSCECRDFHELEQENARLVREREEAITENIALEKDKRTPATGMDVLRADLATARERIALLEELNGKRYEDAKAMLGGYDRENADLRARLDSARAILEVAREGLWPRSESELEFAKRIDSWLASGGKKTTASPEADRSIP